jgi:hypothetical protein
VLANQNRDQASLTCLLLDISAAKSIRQLPLVETGRYAPSDQAAAELATRPRSSEFGQLLPSRHHARPVRLVPLRKVDEQGALSAPPLRLSRDRADKINSRSSKLTSLLLEIPPTKLIRLLPLVETSEYQGSRPHPIEPWFCRLTGPRSSELTSCCRRGIWQGWSDCCPL